MDKRKKIGIILTGLVLLALVIAGIGAYVVQKRVEDAIRAQLAALPEPYQVSAEGITYSLFGDSLTLTGVKFETSYDLADLYRQMKMPAPLGGRVTVRGTVGDITLLGAKALADETLYDTPGIRLFKQAVAHDYDITVSLPARLGGVGALQITARETDYRNARLRPDMSLNGMFAEQDMTRLYGAIDVESATADDIAASAGFGMKASIGRTGMKNFRNGVAEKATVEEYNLDLFGQPVISLRSLTFDNLNHRGLVSPGIDNLPFTGLSLRDLSISPFFGTRAVRSVGAVDVNVAADRVLTLGLKVGELMVSRNAVDDFIANFDELNYPDLLSVHGGAALGYDPGTGTILPESLSLGFVDGFDLALALGGARLPVAPFRKNPIEAIDCLDTEMTFDSCTLTLVDHSFLARFKALLSVEDMRGLQDLYASDASLAPLMQGALKQFEHPGTLKIALKAGNPVTIAGIADMLRDNTLPAGWLTVTQTPGAGADR